MMTTLSFRQAIRQALIASSATFQRSYTDKVRGGSWGPAGVRKVCFYQVKTPKVQQAQLIQDVTEAGGYITGVWSRLEDDHFYCNIRGVVQRSNA